MEKYYLSKSTQVNKKFMVKTPTGKTIHFGAVGYADFTTHKDEERKERYIARHSNEDWSDLNRAGTWSRYILWGLPSLERSIKDMERKFGIKIIY